MRLPLLGVFVPELRLVPIRESQELSSEIEGLGYGVLWLSEANSRDPFANAALLLSATEKLVVGTAVANIWARDALAMQSAAKTLTEAFPERFLLGLGVSHQPLVENMRGHRYEKPLAMMKAYLDRLDSASYSAYPPSTPVRRLLGALGPRMLELAAERSSGVVPYLSTTEHTEIAREAIGDGVVCPIQAVVLDPNPSTARELARRVHTAFYMQLPNYTNNLQRLGLGPDDFLDGGSDRLVDAVVAHGTVERVTQRLQDQLNAGASHVGIYVITGEPTVPMGQLRELAPAVAALEASEASLA